MKQSNRPEGTGKYGQLKVIGITGGVGAGKSTVLNYLKEKYHAKIYLADEVAKMLLKPGQECFEKVRAIFPQHVFTKEGEIDRIKMAELIFAHPEYRIRQNEIVFPAVKDYFRTQIQKEKEAGTKLMIIEAALLIEEHYEELCDSLWYVFTDEFTRRERLTSDRGYSQEKITNIMNSQLTEEEFRRHTDVLIDNSKSVENTRESIDRIMGDWV